MPSRAGRPTRVVVLQIVAPDYRRKFYELLEERLGSRMLVFVGDRDFEQTVRTAVWPQNSIVVKNRYFGGRRLLYQPGVIRPLLEAEVAVLTLNPRIVNVWVVLFVRRLLRRRTVLWGHAWPRKGKASRTDHVRHIMRRSADTIITYTEADAHELRRLMPKADIVAAPNALYRSDDLGCAEGPAPPHDFVVVGRLVEEKKPWLVLEAFLMALRELPESSRLVFVGDGPLRTSLEARAEVAGAGERVVFKGHISDVDELRQIYAASLASISPGYVGLSLIQSIGFGVPMIVARDEPHAPEISAAVEGDNTYYFESDSAESLALGLVSVEGDREYWISRRPLIAAAAAREHCLEVMAERFISALRLSLNVVPLWLTCLQAF